MTTEEIQRADDRELLRRRTAVLRRPCPACDNGFLHAPCICHEAMALADAIEEELTQRGVTW